MKTLIDLTFFHSFDWITLCFALIIAFQVLIGALKGWLKMTLKFAVIAAAIALAFIFFRPVGDLIYKSGFGGELTKQFSSMITKAVPEAGTTLTRAQFDVLLSTQGVTQEQFLHSLYAATPFPKLAYQSLDALVNAGISASDPFTLSAIVAAGISQVACIALAFTSVLLGSYIVLLIISLGVIAIVRKAKPHPGAVSRLLGGLIGLAYGFVLCWIIGAFLNSVVGLGNEWSEAILASARIKDANYWGLAKWIMSLDLPQLGLTSWFTSLLHR